MKPNEGNGREFHSKSERLFRQFLGYLDDSDLARSVFTASPYVLRRATRGLETYLYIVAAKEFSEIKTSRGKRDTLSYISSFCRSLPEPLAEETEQDTARYYGPLTKPTRLYHGTTTAFLPGIMKEGMNPLEGGKCCKTFAERRVFLVGSMFIAEYFALNAQDVEGGEAVVLTVDVKGIEGLRPTCEKLIMDFPCALLEFLEHSTDKPICQKRIKYWYIVPRPSATEILLHYRRLVHSRSKEADD